MKLQFKAINKKTREIEYVDDFYWFEENGIREVVDGIAKGFTGDYFINRCTGKTDKESNLIYENDILISDDYGDEAYNIWIQWNDELASFDVWTLVDEDDWEWHGSDDTMENLNHFTIVGNWYGKS